MLRRRPTLPTTSDGRSPTTPRTRLTRGRVAAVGALFLLLAAAPLVPRGADPDEALRPSAQEPSTSGGTSYGVVTPAMQAEIDRVVAAGLARPTLRGKPDTATLIRDQVRCARFEGLRYCLSIGWTEDPQAQVQARVTAALSSRPTGGETTGDLDTANALAAAALADPRRRAAAERDELTRAAESVAKVWEIRHEVEGVPYPDGFVARHPELMDAKGSADASGSAGSSTSASASTTAPGKKKSADYPGSDKILAPQQTAEQIRSYWCGPTAMQMIAWGWRDKRQPQGMWAKKLGTTSGGTAITSIVDVVNRTTGWDRASYAGPYITLDIGGYSFHQWYLLMMRHIHDYRAPVVLHPILLKKYFPYLDDDASGHFQVGRGYAKRGKKPNLLSYFEPWNQRRFDPSEPFIGRVQWRNAYKGYRANRDHPMHNVGV